MKNKSKFRQYLNAKLLNGNVTSSDLSKVMNCDDNELIAKFIEVLSQKRCCDVAHGYLFPSKIDQIHCLYPIKSTSLEKEIFWYTSILEVYKEKIDLFVRLDREYQVAFLSEKRDNCLEILSHIKNELGLSLWYIKNKITFLQMYMGLKEQKAFMETITKDALPLVYYVASYHSFCAEGAINFFYYKKYVEKEKINTPDRALKRYIEYNLSPFKYNEESDVKDILRFAYRSSIVDLACAYLTYIDVDSTSNAGEEEQTTLINDAIEYAWQGKEEKSKEIIRDGVSRFPSNFAFMELMIKINDEYDIESGVLKKIADNMRILKSSEGKSIRAAGELAKIACLNWYSVWGKYLYVMALKHYDFFYDQLDWIKPLIALSLRGTPLMYEYFIDESFFTECDKERLYLSHVNSFIAGCSTLEDTLDMFSCNEFSVEQFVAILLNMGQPEFALELISRFYFKNTRVYGLRRLEAVCLARLENLDLLLSLIVECAVENVNSVETMPLASCKHLLDKVNPSCQTVEQQIFLHVFSNYFSNDFDAQKRDWLDNYFCFIGADCPKDLIAFKDCYNIKYLKFYLRYICTEQIIDTLPCFQSTLEVSNERIEICKFLIEIDRDNEKEYKDEISGIKRKIRIKARRQGIEKSKVYVDTDGLKRVAEKEICDDFMRLKALWGTRDGYALRNGFRHKFDEFLRGVQTDTLHYPKNEIYSLFVKIILKLTDLFVSNTEYGLDGYLSVRIRHGTLSGLLRSPLEELHLVTSMITSENKYKENVHWKNKEDWPNEVWLLLNNVFCDLSLEFDSFIKDIIANYIQVEKNSVSSTKKFNFSTNELYVSFLSKFVESSDSVDQFVSKVFDEYLIDRLKLILKEVRNDFKVKFKNRAFKIVDDAIVAINKLDSNSLKIRLLIRDLTSAKTKISTVFDHASEWFVFSEVVGVELFLLQDVFEISEENTKITFPDFRTSISYEDRLDRIMVSGSFFHFVDIFDNIFQNIAQHSGDDFAPHAKIVASLSGVNLVIKTSNNVSGCAAIEKSKSCIAKTLDVINSNRYFKYIKTEKGTGLCKIYKIVTHDIGNGASLNFEFDDSKLEFVTTITIPLSWMEVDEYSDS